MIKLIIFKYFLPTPIQFRLIGDCMMVIGAGITGASMYFENKTLQVAVFIGIAGKLITNLNTYNNEKI
jgi:hypothetical protein